MIDRPVDDVFAYLADTANEFEWQSMAGAGHKQYAARFAKLKAVLEARAAAGDRAT